MALIIDKFGHRKILTCKNCKSKEIYIDVRPVKAKKHRIGAIISFSSFIFHLVPSLFLIFMGNFNIYNKTHWAFPVFSLLSLILSISLMLVAKKIEPLEEYYIKCEECEHSWVVNHKKYEIILHRQIMRQVI